MPPLTRTSISVFRNTTSSIIFRHHRVHVQHFGGMANLTTSSKQTSATDNLVVAGNVIQPPRFASGSTNEVQLMAETNSLVVEHGWKLDEEQRGVEKTFYFNTYTKALVCMNNSLSLSSFFLSFLFSPSTYIHSFKSEFPPSHQSSYRTFFKL